MEMVDWVDSSVNKNWNYKRNQWEKKDRIYVYRAYLDILEEGADPLL